MADVEIVACKMALLHNGDATLLDGLSTPEELQTVASIFWDVDVRRINDQTGEVEILLEFEDLENEVQAEEAVEEAQHAYPNAPVEWL